ncbi:unnamed protein product [Prunus armeniaca]|uniref:Uncharacterized protein n=1 Tax=Prunus armeniaca TaxID=36596 RepID=A0A6J5TQV3_PRUAR|nr:unnamed protein product [Prunus armeniaca]
MKPIRICAAVAAFFGLKKKSFRPKQREGYPETGGSLRRRATQHARRHPVKGGWRSIRRNPCIWRFS